MSALVSALTLASADGATTRAVVAELTDAALARLTTEETLSRGVVAAAGDRAHEAHIVRAWGAYYDGALGAAAEIEVGGASVATRAAIERARGRVRTATERAARDVETGR